MNLNNTHKAGLSALLVLAAYLPQTNISAAPEETSETEAFAAIAIPDPYAAKVAKDILMQGGNAVDAAIATGFAMAVTYIDAGNIGGGGFMLTHMGGESTFLDYREKAALAAHRDMYLDEQGEVVENATLIGTRAAAVPGTVAGLWEAHQRYGTLPWRELILPAIALARDGFLPAPILVEEIHAAAPGLPVAIGHCRGFAVPTHFRLCGLLQVH